MILSRKGFDGAAGGCPSPIIDERLLSLPIPSKMPTPIRFGDLNGLYGDLVGDLTQGRLSPQDWCHLDPDINPDSLPRKSGWRGAFGQVSAAQGHLAKQGVQVGDLFVFWGLFRPVQRAACWKYIGKPEHRVWGWLQIGEIIDLGTDGSRVVEKLPWLKDHPHARPGWSAPNVLYVASEQLILGSQKLLLAGSGTLASGYRLTAGATPSIWRVPNWLNPLLGGSGMTYHPLPRWGENTVRSAARGQEFVTNPVSDGRAVEWLVELLRDSAS